MMVLRFFFMKGFPLEGFPRFPVSAVSGFWGTNLDPQGSNLRLGDKKLGPGRAWVGLVWHGLSSPINPRA